MKTPTKVNEAYLAADCSQLNSTGWERARAERPRQMDER